MGDGRRGRAFLIVKGAPERVLTLCTHEAREGEAAPIDREAALRAVHEMASAGLRVLAFAVRRDIGYAVRDLDIAGRVGSDARRPGRAPRSAAAGGGSGGGRVSATAGIRVVMITGDHPSHRAARSRAALGHHARGGRPAPSRVCHLDG